MKKFIYSLGILAAAAFAFSSCQKEQATNEVLTPSEELVTITFNAEKAGIDTKTAAVEGETSVSYEWTDSDVDHMRLFVVSEDKDGKEVLTSVSNITVNKVSGTKLTIAAQVAPNATYTFRAVLAGSWTNDGTKPRVNNTQYPSLSNYDSAADVLVSDDKEVTVGASEQATVATEAMELSFRRLVVVNKMTLKNLTKGEVIDKIVITSTQNLTGYYDTNAKTATGSGKVLTLNYNSSAPVTNDNGQFPVFFTTIPQTDHVLTVEVTTDQFIYTKTFAAGKTIDFNLGQFTKFNFALPAGVANTALALPVEDDMSWGMTGGSDATTEMTAEDLTATQGIKKIYDSTVKAFKGSDGIKLGTSGVAGSIKTNSINLSGPFYVAIDAKTYGSDVSQVKILVDDVSVYTSTDLTSSYETYYINCDAATATSTVTITIDGKRGYINNLVIGSGTYVAPPVINVTSSNPLEIANTGGSQTIAYSIDNPSSGVSLTASTEATWIKNLNYATSGSVTFDVDPQETAAAAREATITLAYTGAKSVNVTVSQAAGAGAETNNYVKVTSTPSDWSGTYLIVSGTKAFNGAFSGASTNYGMPADVTVSDNKIESTNIVDAYAVTIAKSGSNYSIETVANGFLSWTSGNSLNHTTSVSGDNQLWSLTYSSGNVTIANAKDATRKLQYNSGSPRFACYTTSQQAVQLYKLEGSTTPTPTTYAVTWTTPSNGTITATVGGNAISSGDEFEEGTVVNITANPSTGYKFSAWSISGASLANSSSASTSFTVGTSAVNFSASFAQDQQTGGDPVTVSMNTFSEISGYVGGDTNVSYLAEKGTASSAPGVYSDEIRIYQNGGTLTITANNNKKITSVTIGSSMATTVTVSVDGGAASANNSISANGTYTKDSIEASTVLFTCTGTSKSSRLYLNYLSVTYK